MNVPHRWARWSAALALTAALVPLVAAATAHAAPARSADTTTYTSASYLREVLNLPVKAKLVIESVTYDRFQWLLQQEGQLAFLIGDPATDEAAGAPLHQPGRAAQRRHGLQLRHDHRRQHRRRR